MSPGLIRTKPVDIAIDEEAESKANCPNCESVGVFYRLMPRVLEKGEIKPPDYDDFKQCHECGTIVPLNQAKMETELNDFIELPDNPNEFGEIHIEPIKESRNFSHQKADKPDFKRMEMELEKIKDPDLRKELAKGSELISYEER